MQQPKTGANAVKVHPFELRIAVIKDIEEGFDKESVLDFYDVYNQRVVEWTREKNKKELLSRKYDEEEVQRYRDEGSTKEQRLIDAKNNKKKRKREKEEKIKELKTQYKGNVKRRKLAIKADVQAGPSTSQQAAEDEQIKKANKAFVESLSGETALPSFRKINKK
ncbi:hypothetical protein JCM10296v2_000307 [Rhodotorula toruloides]